MRISPFGEGALLLSFEQRIDPAIVARAAAIADAWEGAGLGGAVAAYASVILRFDPLELPPETAEARAAAFAHSHPVAAERRRASIEIPVRYDGPDLAETAALSKMTPSDLIEAHVAPEYEAFFVGFMPGFAYCGPLDPRIVAPRLAVPRSRVAAGSVAVADGQTAVYPLDSPGGWRLIGRTDVVLFDPAADPPARIAAGDRVRFVRTA
ncbi:5-oxoprolinase subunit PxpB [soil metagenome]